MVITNKLNLPQAIVDLCGEEREIDWSSYSVTELLQPVREIILNRRYNKEIEQDCSDMVNLIFGTAVHNLIEKHDKTGMSEHSFKQEVLSKTLKGRCDLYDEENFRIIDYKTATVTKILRHDFSDYDKQGAMYSWLALKDHMFVNEYQFIIFLKDWSARALRLAKLKGEEYPESAIYVYTKTIDTNDLQDIEDYIYLKITQLEYAEKLPDDAIDDCGDEATWYTGNKYAVYKSENDAKAQRVFDNEREAVDYIQAKGGVLVYRKGEYRKCQDYCSCCKYCKYWEERKC